MGNQLFTVTVIQSVYRSNNNWFVGKITESDVNMWFSLCRGWIFNWLINQILLTYSYLEKYKDFWDWRERHRCKCVGGITCCKLRGLITVLFLDEKCHVCVKAVSQKFLISKRQFDNWANQKIGPHLRKRFRIIWLALIPILLYWLIIQVTTVLFQMLQRLHQLTIQEAIWLVEGRLIQVQLESQNSQVPQVVRFQWQGRISKSLPAVREVSEVNDVIITHQMTS